MRTISGTLATLSAQSATRFAALVTITALSGFVLYLTDSDQDIVFGGHTFSSKHGCAPSQMRGVLGASTESVGIDVLMQASGVTPAMIEGGVLDDAYVTIELVDWSNLGAGSMLIFGGFVAQVAYNDTVTATINCQPWSARNILIASENYSSNCRTDFGDARCKVDLTGKQATVTITAIASVQEFTTSDTSADERWQAGLITFTSGACSGSSMEIANSLATGAIVLRGLLPYPLTIGDTATLTQGCDKTPTMCSTRYSNILNFRGEPFTIAPWIKTAAFKSSGTVTPTTPVAPVVSIDTSSKNYKFDLIDGAQF